MSSAERKARKRAGEKFHREVKEGTPVEERVENQPSHHYGPDFRRRYDLTAAAKKRLAAREADTALAVHAKGRQRREQKG